MNGQDSLPSITRTAFARSIFKGRLNDRQACTAIAAIIHADKELEAKMLSAGYKYNVRQPYSGKEHMILSEYFSARPYIIDFYVFKYSNKKI